MVQKMIIEKTKTLSWKEEMLQKLKEEKEITDWAVDLQRRARKDRVEALKKKGLI